MSADEPGGRSASRLGILQVSAAGVLWGTGGLVVTVLHQRDGLAAMTTSAWRMGLAAAALLAFTVLTGRWGSVFDTWRRHPWLATCVGLGTAAYQGLYFVSVLLVGVSVATVVSLGLAPVLAAVWEHLRSRTRPSGREVAVLAAALCGLVLISASASPESTVVAGANPAAGIWLAVAAGATYAATTVLGHELAQRVDSLALTTCATTAGAVVLLPFLAVALVRDQPVLVSSAGSWLLLLYLGLGTMALSYALLYAGLRTTPGSAATVATLVEPVSAAVLAVALLGERLTWLAVLGGGLILTAVGALRPPPEEDPSAA